MKIIASDYDGTFRRPEGILDRDREAVQRWRKAGNLFGIVTGRGAGIDRELRKENVEFDFVIDFNGSEIWDSQGRLLKEFVGKGEKLYEMLPCMLSKEGDWIDIVTKKRSYYVTFQDMLVESRDTWVKQEEVRNIRDFMQIYSLRKTGQDALDAASQLRERYQDQVSALVNGDWLNIAPAGVTKSSGIMEYAKLMGVAKENIFTIGDSYNDLDMIQTFQGFSVDNGSPEIKAAARKIYEGVFALIEDQI